MTEAGRARPKVRWHSTAIRKKHVARKKTMWVTQSPYHVTGDRAMGHMVGQFRPPMDHPKESSHHGSIGRLERRNASFLSSGSYHCTHERGTQGNRVDGRAGLQSTILRCDRLRV
jgi:hypothetical protein